MPTLRLYPAAPFDRVKEILRLINLLRETDQPLTTADGLRQTIAVVLQFAELAGLDQAWLDRLRAIAEDPTSFNLLLAIVQYVDSLMDRDQHQVAFGVNARQQRALSQQQALAAAHEFSDWLPVIVQLVVLLRRTSGSKRAA